MDAVTNGLSGGLAIPRFGERQVGQRELPSRSHPFGPEPFGPHPFGRCAGSHAAAACEVRLRSDRFLLTSVSNLPQANLGFD